MAARWPRQIVELLSMSGGGGKGVRRRRLLGRWWHKPINTVMLGSTFQYHVRHRHQHLHPPQYLKAKAAQAVVVGTHSSSSLTSLIPQPPQQQLSLQTRLRLSLKDSDEQDVKPETIRDHSKIFDDWKLKKSHRLNLNPWDTYWVRICMLLENSSTLFIQICAGSRWFHKAWFSWTICCGRSCTSWPVSLRRPATTKWQHLCDGISPKWHKNHYLTWFLHFWFVGHWVRMSWVQCNVYCWKKESMLLGEAWPFALTCRGLYELSQDEEPGAQTACEAQQII